MPRLLRLRRDSAFSRHGVITLSAAICLAAGITIGVFVALGRGEAERAALFTELAAHVTGLAAFSQTPNFMDVLQSFVGNLLFLAVVWVLAFARIAGFLSFIVIMLQGASYGFTTMVLIAALGARNGLLTAMVYIPQALIMAPALIYVCASSVGYICLTRSDRSSPYGYTGLRRYARVLAVSSLFALFAAILDVYLSPIMARFL